MEACMRGRRVYVSLTVVAVDHVDRGDFRPGPGAGGAAKGRGVSGSAHRVGTARHPRRLHQQGRSEHAARTAGTARGQGSGRVHRSRSRAARKGARGGGAAIRRRHRRRGNGRGADALVRPPRRERQPAVVHHRSAGRPAPADDAAGAAPRGRGRAAQRRARRRRARGFAGRSQHVPIDASRAACRAR